MNFNYVPPLAKTNLRAIPPANPAVLGGLGRYFLSDEYIPLAIVYWFKREVQQSQVQPLIHRNYCGMESKQ